MEVTLEALSNSLKYPLQFFTHQIIGGCGFPQSKNSGVEILQRISQVALAVIFSVLALTSIPLWGAGEIIERVSQGNQSFYQDQVDLPPTSDGELGLDQTKTKHVGFSISTYQNTSNPTFCERSNWGKYHQTHFLGDKAHLRVGQGVDILTEQGMEQICRDVLSANGNVLRFSVEMADVIKHDGSLDEVAMERYVRAAAYVKSQGITPIVTLSHFVHWLDQDGKDLFEDVKNIDQFVSFAAVCYERLHESVDTFVTFNEPNVSAVGNYALGDFPAEKPGRLWTHARVLQNMLKAHERAYDTIHELARGYTKEVKVGLTHQALRFTSNSPWNLIARITCFVMTYLFHESFMQWAAKNQSKFDFLGVQYYTRPLIGGFPPDSIAREGEPMVTCMRFRFDPAGIHPILTQIAQRLSGKSLIITETGTAGTSYVNPTVEESAASDRMDELRTTYYRDSIKAVRRAQDEGSRVIGYMGWSLYRNFEWPHGFSRDHDFGVIARDLESGLTRPTTAFALLASVFERTLSLARPNTHVA